MSVLELEEALQLDILRRLPLWPHLTPRHGAAGVCAAWRGLVAGKSEIGLLYLPDDPATHSVEGSWDDLFFYIMGAIGLLFAVFGAAITRSALKK